MTKDNNVPSFQVCLDLTPALKLHATCAAEDAEKSLEDWLVTAIQQQLDASTSLETDAFIYVLPHLLRCAQEWLDAMAALTSKRTTKGQDVLRITRENQAFQVAQTKLVAILRKLLSLRGKRRPKTSPEVQNIADIIATAERAGYQRGHMAGRAYAIKARKRQERQEILDRMTARRSEVETPEGQ